MCSLSAVSLIPGYASFFSDFLPFLPLSPTLVTVSPYIHFAREVVKQLAPLEDYLDDCFFRN